MRAKQIYIVGVLVVVIAMLLLCFAVIAGNTSPSDGEDKEYSSSSFSSSRNRPSKEGLANMTKESALKDLIDGYDPSNPLPLMEIGWPQNAVAGEYVYIRTMSCQQYEGSIDWTNRRDCYNYGEGVNPLLFTSFALERSGAVSLPVSISVLHPQFSSSLPYYSGIDADVYSAGNDRNFVTGADSYTASYISYEYLTHHTPTLPIELSEQESAYKEYVYEKYMQVPDTTREFLLTVAQYNGFTGDFHRLDVKEQIRQVKSYIENAATYNLEYDKTLDESEDVVIDFLETYKEGVCSHYASAGVLLLRTLGIPARYAVGVKAEVTTPGGTDLITSRSAHAWVEAYIDGLGWVTVEMTGGDGAGGLGGGDGDGDEAGGDEDIPPIGPVLLGTVEVKTYDAVKPVYDGAPLEGTLGDTIIIERMILLDGITLPDGCTFEAKGTSVMDFGVAVENKLLSYVAYDGDTPIGYFNIVHVSTGMLRIQSPVQIEVETASGVADAMGRHNSIVSLYINGEDMLAEATSQDYGFYCEYTLESGRTLCIQLHLSTLATGEDASPNSVRVNAYFLDDLADASTNVMLDCTEGTITRE